MVAHASCVVKLILKETVLVELASYIVSLIYMQRYSRTQSMDNKTVLDPYTLTGVTVTDRVLGQGSYATILELEYMGLKCAGKKIHEMLLRQGSDSYTVSRFEQECRLLSQVRHPNIVQFLGVHFQQGVPTPILVMEFLSTNLTTCIEQYCILPKEISYSILYDVVLVCATSTAKLLPSFTEISLPTMSSSLPT